MECSSIDMPDSKHMDLSSWKKQRHDVLDNGLCKVGDILTPAYAAALGKVARFPVPSAYTLASIKTSFSTWKN